MNGALQKAKFCGGRDPGSRRRSSRATRGLAHQRGLWVVLARDLLPVLVDRVHLRALAHVPGAVAQLAILDEAVRDVDAEPRDPAVEPVAEDPVELRADVRVPPVEIGLLGRELVQVVALAPRVVVPRRAAGEDRLPVVRDVVRPHVVLGPVGEPRMAVGGVIRDEIEPDLDRALPRLRDQLVHVGERPEVRVHLVVVGDVVAPVDVRARERRAQPDRVDTEPLRGSRASTRRRRGRRSRRRSSPRTSAGRSGRRRQLSGRPPCARRRRAHDPRDAT